MKINEFIKNNLKVTNLAKNKDLLRCVKPIVWKNKDMMTSTRLPQIVCVDGDVGASGVQSLLYAKESGQKIFGS